MFDFHADAVARVAFEAAEQGNHRKAAAFFRSILKHHPYSDVAPDALNYLLTNGSVFDRGLTDDQEAARPPLSPLKDAPFPAG